MVDLPLPASADAPGGASPVVEGGEDALRRIVSRVIAWQHRHPLAARITPQEVVGVGIIALPYAQSGAPGARPGELRPLFQQPRLLPGLTHRALVHFAARHAVADPPGPADWPRRDIERADGSREPAPATRYLLTAAVSDARAHGISPRRLLLAPGGPAIWGRRAFSRWRVASAAGAGVVLVAALLAWAWPRWRPVPEPPVELVPAAPASAAAGASAAAHADAVAEPEPPAPASQAAASAATPSAGPLTPAAAPPGPHYALVSAPSKKREVADATLQRVQRLLGPAMGPLQAQIMPTPQGYVVTIWPLPTEADAQNLAEVLSRRGVPMKWMEF